MKESIEREEGRGLFGYDPGRYDAARPPYPEWIFGHLAETGMLAPDKRILEIGAGSGIATRRLLDHGANRLTLVEPDLRFVPLLRKLGEEFGAECRVLGMPFEDAEVAAASIDIVTAATAFHWVDPVRGLNLARRVLTSGGVFAPFWNVLQDRDRPDPFHDATQHLFAEQATGPYGAADALPSPLDREQREREMRAAGFVAVDYFESRWSWEIGTARTRELYGSFSHVQRLGDDEREAFLDALAEIAEREFGGRVVRNMTTCLYVAR